MTPILADNLAGLAGVRHGFFTRVGGVSEGIYGALNCGLGSRDERGRVLANRERVARHLGTDGARLLTCYQIHSATVVGVAEPWAADQQPQADALVTTTRGLALGALAADCTPILFADADAGVIGAAHAGWKGALGGVIEATVGAMERLGAARGRIAAAVGPCIGPDNYEVGPEFEARFLAADPAHGGFFRRPAPGARPYFDLPGFVAGRLTEAGIGRVAMVAECTYAQPERFFSYRRTTHRGEADYGRQISAIMLA